MCMCEPACMHTRLRKPFPEVLSIDFYTFTHRYIFGYDVRKGFNFIFSIWTIDCLSTIKYSNLFPADLYAISETYQVSIHTDSCCFLGSVLLKSHWVSLPSLSLQSHTLFHNEDCSLTMCRVLSYRTQSGQRGFLWSDPNELHGPIPASPPLPCIFMLPQPALFPSVPLHLPFPLAVRPLLSFPPIVFFP